MLEIEKNGKKVTYHDEFYSVFRDGEHWIRITDGCFRPLKNVLQAKIIHRYE